MIRPYKNSDKNNVLHLLRLNTPQYFGASEEADFVEYLDDLLEDYFVLEENGKMIGCGGINYFPKEKTARISWDMIHPNSQGKGVGRKLTEFRINLIKENPLIEKIVVRTSQLAFKFYEKNGFKLMKIEKDYWAKGFDLYLMEMPGINQ